MSECGDAAKAYAVRGFQVIPCRGKIPLTPNGSKDGTDDIGRVEAWWDHWPEANVAVCCGPDLFVLDVDGEDARRGLARVMAEVKAPPLNGVPLVRTGGGGWHWYFAGVEDGRNTASKIAPGVDTRGAGGYVIAPPSVHPDTGALYEWAREPGRELPALPQWLAMQATRLRQPAPVVPFAEATENDRKAVKAANGVIDWLRTVPEGRRNDALYWATRRVAELHAAGLLLPSGWLERLGEEGGALGLTPDEITKTTASGWNAGLAQPKGLNT